MYIVANELSNFCQKNSLKNLKIPSTRIARIQGGDYVRVYTTQLHAKELITNSSECNNVFLYSVNFSWVHSFQEFTFLDAAALLSWLFNICSNRSLILYTKLA